jgi:hypothetical protein
MNLAQDVLLTVCSVMKSNRMRLGQPSLGITNRLEPNLIFEVMEDCVSIESLPAPLPISKISPDQLIEDILVSTLRRVQGSASPEVAAAAARYISLLSESAV